MAIISNFTKRVKRKHFQRELHPAFRGGAGIALFMVAAADGFMVSRRNEINWMDLFLMNNFSLNSVIFLFWIFATAYLLCFILYSYFYVSTSAQITQIDRDLFAEKIIKNAGHNQKVKFCLYLRPFVIDNIIKGSALTDDNDQFVRLTDDNFENVLAQAVDEYIPIVSIRGSDNRFGPGTGSIENSKWREAVLRLMAEAEKIIIVPIAQPSTLWELQQIFFNSYLDKTIFIVPPHANIYIDRNTVIGSKIQLSDLYNYSIDQLMKMGHPLPKLDDRGGIYWYYGRDDIVWRVKIFPRARNLSYRIIRKIIFDIIGTPIAADDKVTYDHFNAAILFPEKD